MAKQPAEERPVFEKQGQPESEALAELNAKVRGRAGGIRRSLEATLEAKAKKRRANEAPVASAVTRAKRA
jgi:hypothetical protein